MSAVLPRPPMSKRDALMPRRADGIGRGLMLAIAVHIGLVIALAFGVHWRSREPETISAELWSVVPQTAAPRAVEPEPPKPAPPQPKPVPPTPKVQTPPPQAQRDAEIAIEKARREREEQAHRAQEEAHRQREERLRQQEEERRAAAKAAAEKRAAEKAAAEKAARERQQQLEAEAQQKKLEAQQKKLEAQRAAQREALRQAQLERMMGQANATGDARATGRAQQSSGPSATYAGRIRAAVRPNIVFNDDLPGNPTAEVEVRLAPDGSILGTPRLLKSSGSRAWDDAVIRALVKTERLPRDIDGHVEPSMVLEFRPRD